MEQQANDVVMWGVLPDLVMWGVIALTLVGLLVARHYWNSAFDSEQDDG